LQILTRKRKSWPKPKRTGLEQRTDGTDAFDNLFIGMNFYGNESGAGSVGMGVLKG